MLQIFNQVVFVKLLNFLNPLDIFLLILLSHLIPCFNFVTPHGLKIRVFYRKPISRFMSSHFHLRLFFRAIVNSFIAYIFKVIFLLLCHPVQVRLFLGTILDVSSPVVLFYALFFHIVQPDHLSHFKIFFSFLVSIKEPR